MSAFWKPSKALGWKSVNKGVQNLLITESADGQRLDNFLFKTLKNVPKSHVYQIIRKAEVRVNGKRAKAESRLTIGDSVRIPPIFVSESAESTQSKTPPPNLQIPVLYEDDFLLAVDKPAGLAVHGGSGLSFGLIEILRKTRADLRFLELAHRLDKNTSGVLLLAKKRSVLKKLHEIFKSKRLEKHYLVGVFGVLKKPLKVNLPLLKTTLPNGERFVRVDKENGKAAASIFTPIAVWESANVSLLNAQILSGRTHQIRVHLACNALPVLNDEKYGDFSQNKTLQKNSLKRMALHAHRLILPYPADSDFENKTLKIESPLPKNLQGFFKSLGAPDFKNSQKNSSFTVEKCF